MGRSAGAAEPSYRPCVGVALVNRGGLVFIGRRRPAAGLEHVDGSHSWQMPQGGIDPGEAPLDAAFRELYEETSIRSAEFLAEAPGWHTYDLPRDIGRAAWRGRYRGQTQKWFLLRFTGDDAEIDIASPGGGGHRPEFDAWRWERLDRLPDLIVPFKRPVYEEVTAAFRTIATPSRAGGPGAG